MLSIVHFTLYCTGQYSTHELSEKMTSHAHATGARVSIYLYLYVLGICKYARSGHSMQRALCMKVGARNFSHYGTEIKRWGVGGLQKNVKKSVSPITMIGMPVLIMQD